MLDSVWLNLIILAFLLVSILASQFHPQTEKIKSVKLKISFPFLLLLLLFGVGLVIYFILFGPKSFVRLYIFVSFCLLILGHGIWLGLNQAKIKRIIYITGAFVIIGLRLLLPSDFTHNLFVFVALPWLGPFFTQLKFLTQKRFIIISCIWFVYDIVYVWLTPLAKNIVATTQILGFPLSIGVGDTFIGTADLLWANCLLAVLPNLKSKWLAGILLLGSNVLLSLVAQYFDISLFPLLVLWAPLSLLVLRWR